MHLRVRDEFGSIREYRQTMIPAVPGQLIKVLKSSDIFSKNNILRVDYMGVNGEVLIGDTTPERLEAEDYLSLEKTSYVWFKRVRHKELDRQPKVGDTVLARLQSGKFMVLEVDEVKKEGVVGRSDDFTRFFSQENYRVLEVVQELPSDLIPYYVEDREVEEDDYVESIDFSAIHNPDKEEIYPAIYKVDRIMNEHTVFVKSKSGDSFGVDHKDIKPIKFTHESTSQVYNVRVVEGGTSSEDSSMEDPDDSLGVLVPRMVEEINTLKNKVGSLEMIFDDMFERLTTSLYLRNRE